MFSSGLLDCRQFETLAPVPREQLVGLVLALAFLALGIPLEIAAGFAADVPRAAHGRGTLRNLDIRVGRYPRLDAVEEVVEVGDALPRTVFGQLRRALPERLDIGVEDAAHKLHLSFSAD